MIRLGSLLSLAYLLFPGAAAPAAPGWKFVEKGFSGIVALESIVVSPNLVRALYFKLFAHTSDSNQVVFFDR